MDDARKRILERRARFVAAAVASLAVGGCERPQPCLSAVPLETRDSGTADTSAAGSATVQQEEADTGAPMPCLSPPPMMTTATPAPCLSPMPPPKPKAP